MGEGASAPSPMQQQKEYGQDPQVTGEGATETPSFRSEKLDFKKWAEVERRVTEITRKRLVDLSPIKDDELSEDQEEYIHALSDPRTSIVGCQSGTGSGKTYTTILTACLALETDEAVGQHPGSGYEERW